MVRVLPTVWAIIWRRQPLLQTALTSPSFGMDLHGWLAKEAISIAAVHCVKHRSRLMFQPNDTLHES